MENRLHLITVKMVFLDTYEAVERARKFGIEVFNVFLSQEPITEDIEQNHS